MQHTTPLRHSGKGAKIPVIPAKAGIQYVLSRRRAANSLRRVVLEDTAKCTFLDSRLHGNDEGRMDLCA
jgi:hypothetical protein